MVLLSVFSSLSPQPFFFAFLPPSFCSFLASLKKNSWWLEPQQWAYTLGPVYLVAHDRHDKLNKFNTSSLSFCANLLPFLYFPLSWKHCYLSHYLSVTWGFTTRLLLSLSSLPSQPQSLDLQDFILTITRLYKSSNWSTCLQYCLVYLQTFVPHYYQLICENGLPNLCRGKESACQWRRRKRCGFNPWGGKEPLGGGAWWALVYRVSKSWTWLSDWACMHDLC